MLILCSTVILAGPGGNNFSYPSSDSSLKNENGNISPNDSSSNNNITVTTSGVGILSICGGRQDIKPTVTFSNANGVTICRKDNASGEIVALNSAKNISGSETFWFQASNFENNYQSPKVGYLINNATITGGSLNNQKLRVWWNDHSKENNNYYDPIKRDDGMNITSSNFLKDKNNRYVLVPDTSAYVRVTSSEYISNGTAVFNLQRPRNSQSFDVVLNSSQIGSYGIYDMLHSSLTVQGTLYNSSQTTMEVRNKTFSSSATYGLMVDGIELYINNSRNMNLENSSNQWNGPWLSNGYICFNGVGNLSVTITANGVVCSSDNIATLREDVEWNTDIYGGFSRSTGSIATADRNTVIMNSGSSAVNVFGGYSDGIAGSSASNNTITLMNCTVTGSVYSGHGNPVTTVTGNRIIIKESPNLTSAKLFGGYNGSIVSNNTLELICKNVTVKSLAGFDNYIFCLTPNIDASDKMLIVTEGLVDLGNANLQMQVIEDGNTNLRIGNQITLIHAYPGVLETGGAFRIVTTIGNAYDFFTDSTTAYLIKTGDSRLNEISIDESSIERLFQFDEADIDIYTPGRSLDPTASGFFTVHGRANKNPNTAIISGKVGENRSLSLFKISQKTNFVLENVTLRDAFGGYGSVLNISDDESSTTLNNIIIENNIATANGGAIYTAAGSITFSETLFLGNSATDGGAFYISSGNTAIRDKSIFNNNSATANGGAICTINGFLNISNGKFLKNTAQNGGAIHNSYANTLIEAPTLFQNNSATESGGAIYNSGTLNLRSSNSGNIVFSGNIASEIPNDLCNNGVLNIDGPYGNVIFEDGISGSGSINKSGNGVLILGKNSDNDNFTGDFVQTAGYTILRGKSFFGGKNKISNSSLVLEQSININNMSLSNATVYTGQNCVHTFSINNFSANGINNFIINIDGSSYDRFVMTNGSGAGVMNVSYFKILGAPTDHVLDFKIFSGNLSSYSFQSSAQEVKSDIYIYNLTSLGNGIFRLMRTIALNEEIFREQITVLAMRQNLIKTNEIILASAEESLENSKPLPIFGLLNPKIPQHKRQIWMKTYGSTGNLPISSGPSVHNNCYGIILGADLPTIYPGGGAKIIPFICASCDGSGQDYGEVSMLVNGGRGNIGTTLSIKNFTSTILLYGGESTRRLVNENEKIGNGFWGTCFTASFIFKLGDFTLRPETTASYTSLNHRLLDNKNISLKTGFSGGFSSATGFSISRNWTTWMAKISAKYIHNFNHATISKANDISLPYIAIQRSYEEYAASINKILQNNLSVSAQFSFVSGNPNLRCFFSKNL